MTETRFRSVQAWAHTRGVDEHRIVRSLESLYRRGLIEGATPPLSMAEAAFLEANSGITDDPQALFNAQLATAMIETDQTETSLTAAEAGTLLGISTSRVNHRLADGDLYALPGTGRGTARKFPAWQFVNGQTIPYLGKILEALPRRFHPLEVEGFFANAIIGELDDGRRVTAREWLASGGDPEQVMRLARALEYSI